MDIKMQGPTPESWKADCVLVFGFEKESTEKLSPALWEANVWLSIAPASADFKGKKKEKVTLYGHPDLLVPRVMLVGLGTKEKASLQSMREAVAMAVKECRERGFTTLGITGENLEYVAKALSTTMHHVMKEAIVSAKLCLYRCEQYKGKKNTESMPDPLSLSVFLMETAAETSACMQEAVSEAEGVLMARDLVNGPANYITPEVLAEESRKLAKEFGYTCTVYSEEQAKDMGMGAFCAVAQGAEQEARFIILEYSPKGKENDDPLIVVGKGITFDTGGISLKPSAKMHEMKGDMAGAAAILGLFKSLGNMPKNIDLPRIIGIIATTENMPGGKATRPGDIVTTLSGQTVEILNTDAEGRLILCDALTYAQKNWKPKALFDIATLTGACVIALGDDTTGVFTDHPILQKKTLNAAKELGELCWPLPMWKEYDKNIDSDVADMANIGPREGGALHAALFLRRFIEKETPWVHLDIAGPGYVVKTTPLHPVAGGTGEGVRLFFHIAKELAN